MQKYAQSLPRRASPRKQQQQQQRASTPRKKKSPHKLHRTPRTMRPHRSGFSPRKCRNAQVAPMTPPMLANTPPTRLAPPGTPPPRLDTRPTPRKLALGGQQRQGEVVDDDDFELHRCRTNSPLVWSAGDCSSCTICALCGEELCPTAAGDDLETGGTDHADPALATSTCNVITLGCNHSFHRECISGWTIVGKKDTCPHCLERVDLKSICQASPWLSHSLLWIELLDGLRYLVVVAPFVTVLVQAVIRYATSKQT